MPGWNDGDVPDPSSGSGTVGGTVHAGALHPLVRALLWGAAYVAAGELGLATAVEGKILTLASPAAGVAALWFVTGSRRTWPWDVPLLVVGSAVVSAQLGVPPNLIVVGTTSTLLAVGVYVALVRRWAGDLAGVPGGTRPTWHQRDLAVVLTAAAVSAVISAGLPTLGQALEGFTTGDLVTFLLRWSRNAAAVTVITTLGLVLAPLLGRPWRPRQAARAFLPRRSGGAVELAGMLAFTLLLYAATFLLSRELPVVFVLFLATAWVGARFPLPTVATHVLLTGVLAVLFTLAGVGPFANSDDTDAVTGVLLAELFVLVNATTALVIGVSRVELAEAERRADERSSLLDRVLTEVGDGIVVIDEHRRVLLFNRAGHEIFGIPDDADDAVDPGQDGAPDVRAAARERLVHTDGSALALEELPHLRVLAGEEIDGELFHVVRPDEPGHRVVRLTARLLPQHAGEDRRVLVVYRDVTADQLHRDALASFAGHVAHDLRNPLTVIEGWAQALTDAFESRGSVGAEAGVAMTRRIENAAARMREFIRELLDFTLARDQSLRPTRLEVGDVAAEVVALREGQALPAGRPVFRVDAPGIAWADRALVRIVLDNLVGNSCKYVAPGVRPEVVVTTREVDDDWLEVAVCDNGIGIPPEQRRLVFESFHRVPQEGYSGTGLGLSICRRIVERHGGSIRVEENPATGGSRFVLTLPRTATTLDRHAP